MHRISMKVFFSAFLLALSIGAFVGPFVGSLHSQDADADDAKAAFDSLFSQQITRARATPNKIDDVALAKELLAAAESSVEHKGLMTLICDAAYTLGLAHRDGYETAMAAQRLLAEYMPEQREQAVGKMLQLRRRLYATSKTLDERKLIAAQLLDDYLSAAATAEEAEDYSGAVGYLRSAGQLASAIKSPRASQISNRYRQSLGRRQVAEDAAVYIEALNKDPKNTAAAMRLVMLYVELADRPDQAVGYAPLLGDETTKKFVALAAQDDPGSIEDTDLLKLGDWYRSLAERNTARNKPGMYRRAYRYYTLFLSRNPKSSLAQTKAKLMISKIESAAKRDGFTIAPIQTASAAGSSTGRPGGGASLIGGSSSAKPSVIIPANFKPIRVPIATGGTPKLSSELYKAAYKGDLNRAVQAIDKGAGVNLSHDRTPILISALRARGNRVAMVQLLLSKGADPNARGRDKRSALWWACSQNDLTLSRLLRQYGAKAANPIELAIMVKDPQWASALIAAGVDPNKPVPSGDGRYEYSLYYLALGGARRSAATAARTLAVVKILLDKGADPSRTLRRDIKKDRNARYTTLMYAAMTANRAVYDLLAASGAKTTTPLHDAVGVGKLEAVEKLSADPKLINQVSSIRDTPLMRAIDARPVNFKIMALLIKRGAAVNRIELVDRPPLEVAIRRAAYSEDGLKAFELLIKSGADPKAKDHDQSTMIGTAVRYGSSDYTKKIVQILLARGVDPNIPDRKKRTPLHYARDEEMVKILKRGGARDKKKR